MLYFLIPLSFFWARGSVFLSQLSLLNSVPSPHINIPQLHPLPKSDPSVLLCLRTQSHLSHSSTPVGKHDPYLHHPLVIILPPEHFSSLSLCPSYCLSLIHWFIFISSPYRRHRHHSSAKSPHSSGILCPLHTHTRAHTPLLCSTVYWTPKYCTRNQVLLMLSFKRYRVEYTASTLHSSGKGIQFMKIGCRKLLSFSQEAIKEDGPDEIFHTKAGKKGPCATVVWNQISFLPGCCHKVASSNSILLAELVPTDPLCCARPKFSLNPLNSISLLCFICSPSTSGTLRVFIRV